MRKCGNSPFWIYDKEEFVGICLPGDFVAEHEWGIQDLVDRLEQFRLNREMNVPKFFYERTQDNLTFLSADNDSVPTSEIGESGLEGFWDSKSFCICAANNTENLNNIQKLLHSYLFADIFCCVTKEKMRFNLNIVIRSKVDIE